VDESYFKYTDEPSSTGSPSILSPDMPPVDPSLGPTNPDLPGNPSKEPVLITSNGGTTRGAPLTKKGRRRGKVEIQEDRPGKEGLEGVGVGAVNVYLVVFRDGIISFHFDDISKHTQGVMDRLLSLEDGRTLSSDWIAHGLMDSIVDSFFPLIDYVEFEADDIDGKIVQHDELVDRQDPPSALELMAPSTAPPGFELQHQPASQTSSDLARLRAKLGRDSDSFSNEDEPSAAYEMKDFSRKPPAHYTTPSVPKSRTQRQLVPPAMLLLFYTLLSRFLLLLQLHPSQVHARRQRYRLKDPHTRFRTTHDFDRGKMLKRMTDTRRLITGLSRLLIPKSEVVGRLKKRAEEVAGRRSGYVGMQQAGLVGGEMVTYIGDVQGQSHSCLPLESTVDRHNPADPFTRKTPSTSSKTRPHPLDAIHPPPRRTNPRPSPTSLRLPTPRLCRRRSRDHRLLDPQTLRRHDWDPPDAVCVRDVLDERQRAA
jgi:magnesium transporter